MEGSLHTTYWGLNAADLGRQTGVGIQGLLELCSWFLRMNGTGEGGGGKGQTVMGKGKSRGRGRGRGTGSSKFYQVVEKEIKINK